MRTIKGQIIASTALDRQSERITQERLQSLFEQMPAEQALNLDHDLSKPFIGRMHNKRFVRIENGEFAIKVDIDVFDEDALAARGGISIAFTGRRHTTNSNRKPEIEIMFNPQLVDSEDIVSFVASSNGTIQIDAVELTQKGLGTAAIVVFGFISVSIAVGFFRAVGADLYAGLKSKLEDLAEKHRRKHKTPLRFQFQFPLNIGSNVVSVLIESDTDNLSVVSKRSLLIEPLLNKISAYAGGAEIRSVSISVRKDLPYLEVNNIVGIDGKVVDLLDLKP